MSTSTTLDAPPVAAPSLGGSASRRAARLHVTDAPDVLVRVLTLMRRRRCTIVGVDYQAADRHRPGHLTVVYEPPPRCGSQVAAWLGSVVDVLAVDDAQP